MRFEDAIRRDRGIAGLPPQPLSADDRWELRLAKRRYAERFGTKFPPFDTTGAPVEFLLRHPEIEPNVDFERQHRYRMEALELQWAQRADLIARGRDPGHWPYDGGDVPEEFFDAHPEAREVAEEGWRSRG